MMIRNFILVLAAAHVSYVNVWMQFHFILSLVSHDNSHDILQKIISKQSYRN